MSQTCPKCGAEIGNVMYSGDTQVPIYKCGTYWDLQEWVVTVTCKDRQIQNLQDKIQALISTAFADNELHQAQLQAAQEELVLARKVIGGIVIQSCPCCQPGVDKALEFLTTSTVPGLVVVGREDLNTIFNQTRLRPATEKERLAWSYIKAALKGKGE